MITSDSALLEKEILTKCSKAKSEAYHRFSKKKKNNLLLLHVDNSIKVMI